MKLSIVIPCKSQSETCFSNIQKIGIPYFDSLGIDYEFLVVIDGSDEKNISLAEVCPDNIVVENMDLARSLAVFLHRINKQ